MSDLCTQNFKEATIGNFWLHHDCHLTCDKHTWSVENCLCLCTIEPLKIRNIVCIQMPVWIVITVISDMKWKQRTTAAH